MAAAGRYQVQAGDGRLASPDEAIFPIVSQRADGTFIAIGTGFFIAEHGIFATASHVVQEVLDGQGKSTGPFGLFQFSPGNMYVVRPILRATRHTVADVAVGVAAPMHNTKTGEPLRNKILTLAKDTPQEGSRACTFAYPKTEVIPGKPQTVRFTPGFFEGRVQRHYPDGRDTIMLPGPCYETSLVLHGAASGGPVFNEAGRVFAVNSTGYGASPVSFVACISSALDLSLDNLTLPGDLAPRPVQVKELASKGFVVVA